MKAFHYEYEKSKAPGREGPTWDFWPIALIPKKTRGKTLEK